MVLAAVAPTEGCAIDARTVETAADSGNDTPGESAPAGSGSDTPSESAPMEVPSGSGGASGDCEPRLAPPPDLVALEPRAAEAACTCSAKGGWVTCSAEPLAWFVVNDASGIEAELVGRWVRCAVNEAEVAPLYLTPHDGIDFTADTWTFLAWNGEALEPVDAPDARGTWYAESASEPWSSCTSSAMVYMTRGGVNGGTVNFTRSPTRMYLNFGGAQGGEYVATN